MPLDCLKGHFLAQTQQHHCLLCIECRLLTGTEGLCRTHGHGRSLHLGLSWAGGPLGHCLLPAGAPLGTRGALLLLSRGSGGHRPDTAKGREAVMHASLAH